MNNLLKKITNKLGKDMADSLDWLMYRQPINKPTHYKRIGRPRLTDYAIYITPYGKKIKEIYRGTI